MDINYLPNIINTITDLEKNQDTYPYSEPDLNSVLFINNINNKIEGKINNIENNHIPHINNDVWDIVINDKQFYTQNKIARIFPILKNKEDIARIKIDSESFNYITIREIAELISKIICCHLLNSNINPQKTIIMDYTAGVGGNVLAFAKYFKYIYAIEISMERAEYLKNNVDVYSFTNIQVINNCCIYINENELVNINPSVIFVDPPWGGAIYKNTDKLLLSINSTPIEELLISIVKIFSNTTNYLGNKFIIFKLPKNYDIEYFYNYVKENNNFYNYDIQLYLHIFNKMLILVCKLHYKKI